MSTPVSVEVAGSGKLVPCLLVDHDAYTGAWLRYVEVIFKDQSRHVNIISEDCGAAIFAILQLRQPFAIRVVDEVSNSGLHQVFTSADDKSLYTLKGQYRFPRGARPDASALQELDRNDVDYIAWKVSEGIIEVWLLGYHDSIYLNPPLRIKVNARLEEVLQGMQQLQGHLQYIPVKLESRVEEPSPFRYTRKLKVYNHVLEGHIEYIFLPARQVLDTPGALFIASTLGDTAVKSTEHGEATLPEGSYILFHRHPTTTQAD